MRFEEPVGDRIVVDGRYGWMYLPSSNPGTVLRSEVTPGSVSVDFHREFFVDTRAKYDATLDGAETVDGHPTHRVLLVPKTDRGYEEAMVWIDQANHRVRRVRFREENGNVKTITLSAIDLNAAPGADAFRFTPPPGTQILNP
jgi:outer membrane lipoprotein carrier protein